MSWGTLFSIEHANESTVVDIVAAALGGSPPSLVRINGQHGFSLSSSCARWHGLDARCLTWTASNSRCVFLRIAVAPTLPVRLVVYLLAAVALYAWSVGFAALFMVLTNPISVSTEAIVLPVVGVSLIFASYALLATPATRRFTRMVEELRTELRSCGLTLNREPAGHRRWEVAAASAVLTLIFVATVIAWFGSEAELSVELAAASLGQTALLIALALYVVAGSVAIVLLVLLVRRPGIGERSRPGLSAVSAALGANLLLAAQLPTFLVGTVNREVWELGFSAREQISVPADVAAGVSRASLEYGVQLTRRLLWLMIALAILLALTGLILLGRSLSIVDLVTRSAASLSIDEDAPSRRTAVSGEGFLRILRVSFSILWFVLALTMWTGMGGMFYVVLRYASVRLADLQPGDAAGPLLGTALALDFVLGSKPECALPLVRTVWIASAGLVVTLVLGSVGSLLVSWRSLRADFRSAAEGYGGRALDARLVLLQRVAAECGHPPVQIVVRRGAGTLAAAVELGLLKRRRAVFISEETLVLLSDAELESLVAHELAHHVNGDCRRHQLLQLLGRLTLFGDAFVGVLEDSFGYELAADRTATSVLGAAPDALARALVALRAHSMVNCSIRGPASRPIPDRTRRTTDDNVPNVPALRAVRRLSERLRLWLALYTSGTRIAYWHPALAERIRRLETMSRPPDR